MAFAAGSTLTLAAILGACGSDDPAGTTSGEGGEPDGSNDGAAEAAPPTRSEFGLDARPSNTTCKAMARPPATSNIQLQRVFNAVRLNGPSMLAQIPGDASRWFVAERGGDVVSFDVANPVADPPTVANVPNMQYLGGEGGLLGLAFHPRFAQNGRLYLTYVTTGGANNARSVVSYVESKDNGKTFGPPQIVLAFDQTNAGNHKGGGIAFGKDGFLYLSFGDGGQGDDAFKQGQNKNGYFSKILRIDVDNVPGNAPANARFGIPDGNPFKNGGGEPATFAYGFRNPFRFSLDRESNELWVGEVGQNQWEEIDAKVKIGGNYGWPCREGMHDYITTNRDASKCPSMNVGFVEPTVEHQHVPQNSRSITGGVVYRGKAIPSFVGRYIYGDYAKKEIWTLFFDPSTGEAKNARLEGAPAGGWVNFAEDQDGEVYALSITDGTIHKVVASEPAGPSTFPELLSQTGCVDPSAPQNPASGLIPYGVNAPLWSDGADKARWLALPDGQTITVKDDGDFDFPSGTVLVKTFSLGGKKIETRLFMRHDDGEWAGYTYEWKDDQSDAVLLPSSKTKVVGAQTWQFPSRSDCVNCHSEAAGRSLGLELGQLNGDFVYPSTNRISNQLTTLEHIGMFAAPLGKPATELAAFPDPLGSAPLDARARAYLHANCANCHRPEGQGGGDMDLRFATALGDTKTCNVDPQRGDLGIDGAKLLLPGDPSKSVLSLRPHSPAANRMPPLASSVVDDKGLVVVDGWIDGLTGCP